MSDKLVREEDVHWFTVPRLLEDLRGHVAWGTACCSQDMKCFFVHYSRQAEIGYEQIGVVFWCSKKQIFGFEVAMDDAVVVKVGYSGECSSDEICGIGFVVAAFPAYSVEELAAEGKIGH